MTKLNKACHKMKNNGNVSENRIIAALLYIAAIIFLLPIMYVILSSFRFQGEIGIGQYRTLLYSDEYFRALKNSFIYALCATFSGMLFALPVAYFFAKITFRGRDSIFLVYITVLMLPAQSTILGQYILMQKMNVLNTKLAVLIPLIMSPIVVFLLRQNLKSVDGELIEAVKMDTNSFFLIMHYIILPQIKKSLYVAILLLFCECWNVVEPAIILLPNATEEKPLSVMMSTIPEELRSAGAVIYMLPILIAVMVLIMMNFSSPIKLDMDESGKM